MLSMHSAMTDFLVQKKLSQGAPGKGINAHLQINNPSDMSAVLPPSLPAPPPQEQLQFVLPREDDTPLPVICCPRERVRKRYTVNFELVAM